MKNICIIILFLSIGCFKSEKYSDNEEESIETVVHNILQISVDGNLELLNQKYINDSIGLWERKKIGAIDHFIHHEKIENETSAVGTIYQIITSVNQGDINKNPIYFDKIKYDCNFYEWNKSGLIISKSFEINESPKFIKQKNSYKIVVTDKDLVFYLTYLNGNYYITLIDRVITDCGA